MYSYDRSMIFSCASLFFIRWWCRSIFFILLFTNNVSAKVLEIGDLPEVQLGIGGQHSWVGLPDKDTQRRLGFELSYLHSLSLDYQLSTGAIFIYLPDTTEWSKGYEIYFDQYHLFFPITYSLSYVFRYRIFVAAGLSIERSTYNLLSKKDTETAFLPSLLMRCSLEHAITSKWEASLAVSFLYRPRWQSYDLSYSFLMSYNMF